MDLDDLRQRLESARATFLSDGESEHGTPMDKQGAVDWLAAVNKYLLAQGVPRPLLRPGRDLMAALVDAETGVDNQLIEKRRFNRRPPLQRDQLALTAAASVVVTLLMRSGRTKDEACRYAANSLEKAGFVFGRTDADNSRANWKPLRDARDKLMRCERGDDGLRLYETILANAESQDYGPREAALRLLRGLPEMHRPHNGRNPALTARD